MAGNVSKNQRRNLFIVAALIFSCLLISGCGSVDVSETFRFDRLEADDSKPMIVGQVPSRSVIELFENRKQFIKAFDNTFDRDVQLRVADSYVDIIDGMASGKFDVVFLGPLSYVKAVSKREAQYKPLIRPVRRGNPYYYSMIFTHQNSGITSLSQLEAQSIAFVDPESTSGYLFPRAHIIAEAGFDPIQSNTQTKYLGSHDKVIQAVKDESFTAGATFFDAREVFLNESEKESLPLLARTKPIPSEPVAINNSLSDRTVDKIESFFLTLHEERPNVLDVLGENIDQYVKTDDSDYDDVRTVIETLEKADKQ